MLRRLFVSGDGDAASTEPQLRVFLRDTNRYPGDDLCGMVLLHLPAPAAVVLLEVTILGQERARIGVLSGSANFEARTTTYYRQFITMLGAVPQKLLAKRQLNNSNSNSNNNNSGSRDRPLTTDSGSASDGTATQISALTMAGDEPVIELAAGTYLFPFSIPLPFILPPSRIVSKGREACAELAYSVDAQLLLTPRTRKAAVEHSVTFTMLPLPLQLQRWLIAHRPEASPTAPAAAGGALNGRSSISGSGRGGGGGAGASRPGTATASAFPRDYADESSGYDDDNNRNVAGSPTDSGGGGAVAGAAANGRQRMAWAPTTTTTVVPAFIENREGRDGSDADEDESDDGGRAASPRSRVTEHDRVLRRRINHEVNALYIHDLGASELRMTTARREAQRQRCGKKSSTAEQLKKKKGGEEADAAAAAAAEEEENTVFVMECVGNDDDDDGDGAGGHSPSVTTTTKTTTRMVASEVDRIGFGSARKSDTAVVDDDNNKKDRSRNGGGGRDVAEEEAVDSDEDERDRYYREKRRAGGGGEGSPRGAAAAAASSSTPAGTAGGGGGEKGGTAAEARRGADRPATATTALRAQLERPWEIGFSVPVRSGLMSRSAVGVTLTLRSNILIAGRDVVRVETVLDNTEGGGPITKVCFSLITRQRIRSKVEKFPFSTVVAETTWAKEAVRKGKVGRLPPMELSVPATTPITCFTDGAETATFLNVRVYSSTTLHTFSRSAEVEVMVVKAVDTENRSRRLCYWTNYFIGNGLPKARQSAPPVDLHPQNADPRVLSLAEAVAAAEEADLGGSLRGSIGDGNSVSSVYGGGNATPSLAGSVLSLRSAAVDGSGQSRPGTAGSIASSSGGGRRRLASSGSSNKIGHLQRMQQQQRQLGRLPMQLRRLMSFTEAVYLPPHEGDGGSGGVGGGGGVNPLLGRRSGSDGFGDSLDRYEDEDDI